MKTSILLLLVLVSFTSLAQFNRHTPTVELKTYKFNVEKSPKLDLKLSEIMNAPSEPSLKPAFHLDNSFNINSRLPSGGDYWIGRTTNFYSADNNFKATYTYDLQGNVRNSSFSFTFKKRN